MAHDPNEPKTIVNLKCPSCKSTKEIRQESCVEPNGEELIYYRCKECSWMWDNGEVIKK